MNSGREDLLRFRLLLRDLRRDDLGELAALLEHLLLLRELLGEEALHPLAERERAHREAFGSNEAFEISLQLARRLVPLVAVLRERAHDDLFETRRQGGVENTRPRVLPVDDEAHRVELARALEEAAPGAELEENHAEAEDVAARVEQHTLRLLRAHVRDLSLELAALRLFLGAPAGFGDAEVDELHVAAERDEDVLRAHVTVHDVERLAVEAVLLVRVCEPRAAPEHDRERVLEREGRHLLLLHLPHDRAQVLAVDVLHGDEVLSLEHADVVDVGDVRVVQRGRDASLVEEHLDEVGVLRQVGKDALDDDQLLEAGHRALDAEEELGHATEREPADEGVLAEALRHLLFGELGRAGGVVSLGRRRGWRCRDVGLGHRALCPSASSALPRVARRAFASQNR